MFRARLTVRDAVLLLIVVVLASLYSLTVYAWLGGGSRCPKACVDRSERLERLGLSIVLAAILLSVFDTSVSALLGSRAAAVVVAAAPLSNLLFLAYRRRGDPNVRRAFAAMLTAATARLVLCSACILATAGQLFRLDSLASRGIFHPDLLWHVGRIAEQAFQSSPGFIPRSPIAFPDRLPYQSFVVDALAAATFRYLPFPLHAFNFCQVAFAWSLVLWTAVVLIAAADLASSLLVLTTAVLLVPAGIWGVDAMGSFITTSFHSNLNSLVAWQIGLAFVFHLFRSFRRGTPPSSWFVLMVPASSVFFKVNEAFAFAFLGVIGLAQLGWSTGSVALLLRQAAGAFGLWLTAFAFALALGPWPVSAGVHGSMEHVWYYLGVAMPAWKNSTGPHAAALAVALLAAVALAGVVAAWRLTGPSPAAAVLSGRVGTYVVVPTVVLAAAMLVLFVGWWLVVPIGIAEGEPMHVNFMVIPFVVTAAIGTALCVLCDTGSRTTRGSLIVGATLVWAVFAWRLNTRPADAGGLVVGPDYDVALERKFRAALSTMIPGGDCFGYNRRYVIYTVRNGEVPPDFAIAATGCPQLNGSRWRGLLGNNDPEALMRRGQIEMPTGEPFRVVAYVPCVPPPPPANVAAVVRRTTVSLSWTAVPDATVYAVEAGSHPGWSDVIVLNVGAVPSLVAPSVSPRLYYVRVRAVNACGSGGASEEIQVRVSGDANAH